ncbi:hypothetical protein ACWT_0194 [Actinoplanes sp. SE50]|uniref:hypothetical protein n=1 Tax=unclassified Actinoplanes TaxID=2626549 RepID=UPI00023ED6F1|nr:MULTISPECIES: hypothetical protein [unclassified Actinoplanes]AEV81207.1 hypothetical protein ACPL_310 [Actinoplanes sp. SE50/110]ATO79609.1 hypothetical protein ACWT_0194 [Actinoplanes sp. SE50]SLL97012.1 hypothetical protein ACSP50_0208 [Actinoplanes sp. SE50/110]
MRIRTAVAALAMTAGAAAGSLALTGPAMATPQNGLVNVYAQDIASGNQVILLQNVPVDVAANVCGLTVNVLSTELLSGNHAVCTAKNTPTTKSWVSYS